MKDSDPKNDRAARLAKSNQSITVSERKLKANKENAKKSTGPKTSRGKANSRRNALKHGLFARQFMDFVAHGEDPEEYKKLLSGLRAQYEPIGTAEELDSMNWTLTGGRTGSPLRRLWRRSSRSRARPNPL
jgi:hypothetical protein